MDFFKDISKKIGETAKEAAKKSSDFVETTKLSMQIDKNNKEIDNHFYEIGKALYENYCDDNWVKERFENKISIIEKLNGENESIKKELLKKRNAKTCKACEAELDKEAMFCPKCGARYEAGETVSNTSQAKDDDTSNG